MPRASSMPPLAVEVQQLRALLPQQECRSSSSSAKPREQRVQVFCRFRDYILAKEMRGDRAAWKLAENSVSATEAAMAGALSFSYDRVFGANVDQAGVYTHVEPVVQDVLKGVNGAVLCYGQTSAGKTFTMEGEQLSGAGAADGELRGIIPRSLESLFGAAQAEEEAGRGAFRFTLSMLEIYMERLRDLLDPDSGAELRIVEDRTKGIVIRGLREVVVDSIEMALEVFLCGRQHRAVGATGMNDRSSRSHSIFVLKAERLGGPNPIFGKLCLVDLAGSECLKKACLKGEDVAVANAGILEEAKAINQSLSTLGLVVNRLASRRPVGPSNARGHVPYRSSRLTHALKDVVGGSSQTVLVVNCSPSSIHVAETLSTLRFGARARSVVNMLQGTNGPDGSALAQTLRDACCEIKRLQLLVGRNHCRVSGVSALPLSDDDDDGGRESEMNCPTLTIHDASCSNARGEFKDPSLSASGSRHGSVSPLDLSPRSALASRRASLSRRESFAPRSARQSLAVSDADDVVSLLDLSPRSRVPSRVDSRRASFVHSKRNSFAAEPEPPLPSAIMEDSLEYADLSVAEGILQSPSPVRRRGGSLPGIPSSASLEEAYALKLRRAEHKVECTKEELIKKSVWCGNLEQQLAALQAENEWLMAERVQHIEHAVESSFEGSIHDNLTTSDKSDSDAFSDLKGQVDFLDGARAEAERRAQEAEENEELQRIEALTARDQAQALREDLNTLRSKISQMELEHESAREETERLSAACASAMAGEAAAAAKAMTAESDAASLRDELRNLQASAASMRSELVERKRFDEEVKQLRDESKRLEILLDQKDAQAAKASAAAESEASALRMQVQSSKEASERIVELQALLDEVKGQNAVFVKEKNNASELLKASEVRLYELETQLQQQKSAAATANTIHEEARQTSEVRLSTLATQLEQQQCADATAKALHDKALQASEARIAELLAQLEQQKGAAATASTIHEEAIQASKARLSTLAAQLEQQRCADVSAKAMYDQTLQVSEARIAELVAQLEQQTTASTIHEEARQASEARLSTLAAQLEQQRCADATTKAMYDQTMQVSEARIAELVAQLEQQTTANTIHEEARQASEVRLSALVAQLEQQRCADGTSKAMYDKTLQVSETRINELGTQLEQQKKANGIPPTFHAKDVHLSDARVSEPAAQLEEQKCAEETATVMNDEVMQAPEACIFERLQGGGSAAAADMQMEQAAPRHTRTWKWCSHYRLNLMVSGLLATSIVFAAAPSLAAWSATQQHNPIIPLESNAEDLVHGLEASAVKSAFEGDVVGHEREPGTSEDHTLPNEPQTSVQLWHIGGTWIKRGLVVVTSAITIYGYF